MATTTVDMSMPALMAVWLEIAPLRTLKNWQPVGSLFELIDAIVVEFYRFTLTEISISEGLTPQEILRLRKWSKRWSKLHREVQEFYIAESHWQVNRSDDRESYIDSALWKILDSDVWFKPHASLYLHLSERWVSCYGRQPAMELIPNLTMIQVRRNDASRMQNKLENGQ